MIILFVCVSKKIKVIGKFVVETIVTLCDRPTEVWRGWGGMRRLSPPLGNREAVGSTVGEP